MGEAKRRQQEQARARASVLHGLEGHAAIVATTAIALFENYVWPRRYTGGCYLTTMFLSRYLREERGVTVKPVVGYVNDGTDDIFMSHAWIEFEGLKTDLTLHLLSPNFHAPSGCVLILDRTFRQGEVQHSYHVEQTPAGQAQTQMLMSDPSLRGIVLHKEREHREMLARMADPAAVKTFMDGAPLGVRYGDMMAAVD